MNFEEYLTGKKIDSQAFRAAEPAVWERWKMEFDQIHPNSFTVQKLNIINPIRRKYQLKDSAPVNNPDVKVADQVTDSAPKPTKPVMRPKPKMN